MRTSGSDPRAIANMTGVEDAEVVLTYTFSDRNNRSGFRTVLRGSGDWPLTAGYRVEVQSDSSTIKLRRFIGGENTTCATCSFSYSANTNPQRLRFRVLGGRVQVKVWPAGTAEPGTWQVDWTDPAPLPSWGVLQLQHNWTNGTRDVSLDDLSLIKL
jgi:hypothetical protein